LKKSNALFGTPIERLAKMNPKAIELYKTNGIDLYREPLRVAVCAQHCNGGVAVDANWECSVKGLYAVGEAAGTFGVYRPGGSALNSTQVGSMRAAEHIAHKAKSGGGGLPSYIPNEIKFSRESNIKERRKEIQTKMSKYAAFLRDPIEMRLLYDELKANLENFFFKNRIQSEVELPYLYKNYDILLTQTAVLSAMLLATEKFGSRGGGLVSGAEINTGADNDKIITTNKNHDND